MHIKDTPKERERLLRLLMKQPAHLTLPLGNPALRSMMHDGFVEITGRYRQEMATRCYDCIRLSITDAGREELAALAAKRSASKTPTGAAASKGAA